MTRPDPAPRRDRGRSELQAFQGGGDADTSGAEAMARFTGRPAAGTEVDLAPAWTREPLVVMARQMVQEGILGPVVRALGSLSVSGTEHLLGLDPPLVIAANHASHADVIVIRESVPAAWRPHLVAAAAADYFFQGGPRLLAASLAFNTLPLERYESPRRSLRTAVRVLHQGAALVIFPEGGRLTGRPGLRPFQGGVAFLAKHAGVPVVPLCISGTQDLLPKGRSLPRRAPVSVRFGPPIRLQPGERLQGFTQRVRLGVMEAAAEQGAWQLVYGQATEESEGTAEE